jgi:hypothetical protein
MTDTAMKVSKTLTDSWSNLERKTRESCTLAKSIATMTTGGYETAYRVESATLGELPVIPSVFIVGEAVILTPAGLEVDSQTI